MVVVGSILNEDALPPPPFSYLGTGMVFIYEHLPHPVHTVLYNQTWENIQQEQLFLDKNIYKYFVKKDLCTYC